MRGVVFGLVFLVATSVAALDPRTDWQTVSTPHFQVHAPLGLEATAQRTAHAAERAMDILKPRLGHVPDTFIHIVLINETDSANGFATVSPYPIIGLNVTVPATLSPLADYDDWLFGLVVHELAHVLHLDAVLGVPSWVNVVLGRYLFPNSTNPRWFTEGLATYFESSVTGRGRVGGSFFEMILRMSVLADRPLSMGEITASPNAWPFGRTPYLYGSYLLDYVARTYGEETLRAVSLDYGSRLIPYAMNASLLDAAGVNYDDVHRGLVEELEERFLATRKRLEAEGLREGERLTFGGGFTGPARLGQDGAVYFFRTPVGQTPGLFSVVRGRQPERISEVAGGGELALHGSNLCATMLERFNTYHTRGDLFCWEDGAPEQKTHGARIFDVDISPAGDRFVFGKRRGFESTLVVAPREEPEAQTTVVDLGPGGQVWTPRFAPDGRSLVFVGQLKGQRNIYTWEFESATLTQITFDTALEGYPTYTPDGRYIVFHSDRDGISNLYAWDTKEKHVHRITRALGGAFAPEVVDDGRSVVFLRYGEEGFDLARIDFKFVPEDIVLKREPVVSQEVERSAYEIAPYAPTQTLLPTAWFPLLGADTQGSTVGASTFGQDVLGQHGYGVVAWYGISSNQPGAVISYRNSQFHPGISFSLSRRLAFAAVPLIRNGIAQSVEEDLITARASMSWPLLQRRQQSVSLNVGYAMTYRRQLQTLPEDGDITSFPDQGRFARLSLGLGYSNVRRGLGAAAAQQGIRLSVDGIVEHDFLGSQFRSALVRASGSGFIRNPLFSSHTLAVNLQFGYGTSNYQRLRLFQVGGLPARDLVLDFLGGRLSTPFALRGFPVTPFSGNVIVEGHVEYRFPIWSLDSGVGTLPFYFRRFHGAWFLDGASVADGFSQLEEEQHYSTGVELRIDFELGYGNPWTVRLGYGFGLGDDDVRNGFLVIGSTF